MATNVDIFNRYSSNIAYDGALAIYDILPDTDVLTGDVDVWSEAIDSSTIKRLPDNLNDTEYAFYPIPSSHCVKSSTAYYLHSKTTGHSEVPVVSGTPLTYGGTARTRYSLLSRDIISASPLLLIPSFGIGHRYPDRARSLEFWINTEPYSHNVNSNMLVDSQARFQPDLTDYTGSITLNITDSNAKNAVVTDRDSYTASTTSSFVFNNGPVIEGGRTYTVSIAAKGTGELTLSTKLIQIPSPELSKTYSKTFTLTNTWVTYSFSFVADDLLTYPVVEYGVDVDGLTYIADSGIWAGIGGSWQVPGYEVGSDVTIFEVSDSPEPIIEFGGEYGTSLSVLADSDYIYLKTNTQIASYHVGEWSRPLYVVINDSDDKFSLFINGELVCQVNKGIYNFVGLNNEWAMFYISPQFKYIDLSTIAIYKKELPVDLQKLHYVFGAGPQYQDVISRLPFEKMYVADGSSIDFSGALLFPQTQSFTSGISHGIDITGNTLSLPQYALPTLSAGSYSDIVYGDMSQDDYGIVYFKIPANSEMSISPKSDVDNDINYIFIDVASPLAVTGTSADFRICRIDCPSMDHAIDFYFYLDEGTDGDFSEDFSDDFNTTLADGRIVAVPVFKTGNTKTYGEYESMFSGDFTTDFNYNIETYGTAAGRGSSIEEFTIAQTDFTLALNVNKLMLSENRLLSSIFGDSFFTIRFDDNVMLKSISMSSNSNLKSAGILFENEDDIDYIQVEPKYDKLGFQSRQLIDKATYSVYPNVDYVDGQEVKFLDIAANGYWKVNIPLTALSTYLNYKPDLDFIIYSDSEARPSLVYGLKTNRMSYDEVLHDVQVNSNATYDGAQTLYGSTEYQNVGLNVSSTAPSIGRFYNPAIRTYVTLDSQIRWPFKDYELLQTELASNSGFIDFAGSNKSVLNTKWEIFNGNAIRIPKNIDLFKYDLGFAVHISTRSQALHNPSFRSADFLAIASGSSSANSINTGLGNKIYVGIDGSFNISKPYSLNVPTESLPASIMPKDFGFYPHKSNERDNVSLVFPMSITEDVSSISFYMMWRGESFGDGSVDIEFAQLQFKALGGEDETLGLLIHSTISEPNKAVLNFTSSESGSVPIEATNDIYIDGIEDAVLYANKWHLVQLDINNMAQLAPPRDKIKLLLTTDKVVMNYVTSHGLYIDPENLYASRFGISNIVNVDDEPTSLILDDKSRILVFSEYKQPDIISKINA